MGKLALYSALSVLLIIAVVIAIGALLPKKHVAARAISLHRSPPEVFALISDFQAAPTWQRGVEQVNLLPSGNGYQRFTQKSKDGTIAMEVRENRPPTRLVTEIADKSLPFGGFWIFEVTPTSEGCTLQITERGEIYNPVFRFVSRFILGYEKTINMYLSDVATHFHEQSTPTNATPTNF